MKKFLTVLLALSVVFTYTVGSAFAASLPTLDVQNAVNAKKAEEMKLVEAAKIAAVRDIKNNIQTNTLKADKGISYVTVNGQYFTTDDLDKLVTKVIADAQEELDKLGDQVLKTDYADKDALNQALATITAGDYAKDFSAKLSSIEKLPELSLTYAKERYTAVVNGVNLDDYSAEKDITTGKSNRDLVESARNNALDKINAATVAYTDANSAQMVAENFLTYVATVPTITDDGYDAADLATVKELAISAMTVSYTEKKAELIAEQNKIIRDKNSTAAQVTAAKEQIEKIEATYSAAMTLLKDQINALTSLKNLNVYGADGNEWAIGTYSDGKFTPSAYLKNADMANMVLAVEKADKIADLKETAEYAKQFIGIEGSKYFSEAEVDKALEKAINTVYAAKSSAAIAAIKLDAMTPAEALAARINELIGAAGKNVIVDKSAYPTVEDWADKAGKNYTYDSNVANAVKKLAKDTKTALKEAKSISEAEKLFLDAYAEYNAFVTDAEHNKLYAKGGALYESATSYEKQIEAAIAAKEIVTKDNTDYNFNVNKKFAKNLIAEMKKANTQADLDAKYAEAIDIINNVKTVSAIKAEVKALNDRALAIKTVDASAKAEVLAILDGYADMKDYIETIDTTVSPAMYETLVKSYLQTIADTEAKAINDAIKAVGDVTVADKDAIESIRADYDAYAEMVADYGIKAAAAPTETTVAKLEAALSDAQVKEVIKMIMNLDTVVTSDNIADVEAAVSAYDALKADQKAQISDIVYDKLISVKKAADNYKITAVESLKITASSVAAKGSITVKWKVQGDYAMADGMRVYKSTKKNSGYGATPYFITKAGATQYKNTKELKKGTRYYYKVRAYVEIDGVKYYSDYSNKAYRIAK